MTADQILLYSSFAGLIALLPSIPILFISTRGSIRRAIYRLSISRRVFKPAGRPSVAQALISASTVTGPLTSGSVATLARCIDYYAYNKVAVEDALFSELSKLKHDDRQRLLNRIDDLRGAIEQTTTSITERRLAKSNSPAEYRVWLSIAIFQHMAVRGSWYYVNDFVDEIKNALSKIESLRS